MRLKEDILKLKNRRDVFNLILNYPGLHQRKILKKINISEGTIKYHINYLLKQGFISEEFSAGYKRYYATDKISRLEKEIMGIIRRETPRRIILFSLLMFCFSRKQISKELEKDTKTIQHHLDKLKEMNIIEVVPVNNGEIITNRNNCIYRRDNTVKKEILYQLKDPYLLYHFLLKYKNSFFDDKFTEDLLGYLEEISMDAPRKSYDTKIVDRIENLFFDFFPYPICA